jgi:hypothetical protein
MVVRVCRLLVTGGRPAFFNYIATSLERLTFSESQSHNTGNRSGWAIVPTAEARLENPRLEAY